MGEELGERTIGALTVLFGARGGKYPSGNSLLVTGRDARAVIDPSLGLVARSAVRSAPAADLVLNSHCHEDHIAGNHLYPDVPWHLPDADLPGIRSLEALLELYGYPGAIGESWRRALVEQFHFVPRPDALGFADGAVFELGGGVRIRALHAPGHTRGHTLFAIEPDGVLYLADIDLSSFGPYYGDAWSELGDFRRTLLRARELDARFYATFHHVGVLDSRAEYLERLARFTAVIDTRESRLLAYLAEPHTLDDVVRHRFVYRSGDAVAFADAVERRSMGMHLGELLAQGRVAELQPGLYRAV
jgi:glyoxylase-like metal-dependent hydrolase (beta-lactamase superfamily II)